MINLCYIPWGRLQQFVHQIGLVFTQTVLTTVVLAKNNAFSQMASITAPKNGSFGLRQINLTKGKPLRGMCVNRIGGKLTSLMRNLKYRSPTFHSTSPVSIYCLAFLHNIEYNCDVTFQLYRRLEGIVRSIHSCWS